MSSGLVFAFGCECLLAGAASAEERSQASMLFGTSVSYFAPTKDGRRIHSVFLDGLVGVELWRPLGVSVHGGLTGTVASGYITQWGENFVDVRYDTNVAGAGPMFAVRLEPVRALCPRDCGGFSLLLEFTGALVFYTAHFPPGGDIYNFAWRMGGSLGYALSPRCRLELGGRWMHVSNGQGLGGFNPSYEGAGVALGAQFTL